MERVVQQIQPNNGQAKDTKKPFNEYMDTKGLVLLGAPGAGKTHLLKEAAKPEDCYYLTAKSFLNRPVSKLTQFECLFIDALDEQRASAGTQDVLSQVVKKLWEVHPQKVRLACRIADWHGDLDLDTLNDYLCDDGGQKATVVQLEPLTEQDVLAILIECNITEPDAFFDTAKTRGLAELLGNPQTLKMLATVVSAKQWPATKKELFEQASDLLLTETSGEHLRSALVGNAAGRLDCAGAICAARLIADVEGVYLSATESHLFHENWLVSGEIHIFEHTLIESVLRSRLFIAHSEQEFDYSHRMVAEYQAARWIAKQIQDGLPLSRVMAVISVNEQPVSELRGLYAWLTLYLPEEFNYLVLNDTLTILLYSDIASFSSHQKQQLLTAIEALANDNPYFMAGHFWSLNIAGLAVPELAARIKKLLTNKDTPSHLKTMLYQVLEQGLVLNEMSGFLREITLSQKSHYALLAYLTQAKNNRKEIRDTYRALGNTHDEIMLRAESISRLYNECLEPVDMTSLLLDAINSKSDKIVAGYFWKLHELVRTNDIPQILNPIITHIDINDSTLLDGISWDAFSTICDLLTKWVTHKENLEFQFLWDWLIYLERRLNSGSMSSKKQLSKALQDRASELSEGITPIYIKEYCSDQQSLSPYHFDIIMLGSIKKTDLLSKALAAFRRPYSDKHVKLYKLCLNLCMDSPDSSSFWNLYDRAEGNNELISIRDSICFYEMEAGIKLNERNSALKTERNRTELLAKKRRNDSFTQSLLNIENGSHLSWLGEIAYYYLGRYANTDQKASPKQRLITEFGETGSMAAIRGVINLVKSQPEIDLSLAYKDHPAIHHFSWWYSITVGLNELLLRDQKLTNLTDEFLVSALQADFTIWPYINKRGDESLFSDPWKHYILEYKPNIFAEAWCLITEYRLSFNIGHTLFERELFQVEQLAPFRPLMIRRALLAFKNNNLTPSTYLLSKSLKYLDSDWLKKIISEANLDQFGSGKNPITWLGITFVLHDQCIELATLDHETKKELIWELDSYLSEHDYLEALSSQGNYLNKLEKLISLSAEIFPLNIGVPDGGTVSRNAPWKGSRFLLSLVNRIAEMDTLKASQSLTHLSNEASLSSYQDDIKHKLFEQRALYVNASFKPPTAQQALNVLENKAPANIVDLQALIMDTMQDIQRHINGSNEDAYRAFWNEPKGKPSTPKWEESCRDALLPLLRHNLEKFGIHVEPEVHMVKDKRADLVIFHKDLKMVFELKRVFHSELWTAANTQLDRLYTRDPNAQGYGIYGVFWYGDKHINKIKKHPDGLEKPNTPRKLCKMLVSQLTAEQKKRIAVFVLDVSEPSD